MSDWTEGYLAEIAYTHGYYAELNPLRLAMPLVNVGLRAPTVATACELGFGQGGSINTHAAASDVEWYGTDFNPAHAAQAQAMAAAAGSGAQLYDQAFAEFCARSDLPDFDFVGVHGIWSWVSEENRRIIVDFVRRKLRPGGVLYISYNCQPGHAATLPLQHLFSRYSEVMTPPGRGILGRVEAAIGFTEQLLALNPVFALANPTVAERLKVIKGQNRQYLAHEYFNRNWRAMLFSEMVDLLGGAKMTYGCSASFHDHIDVLNLTPEQRRFLDDIPDRDFRESVRDFVVNQQFRRDYWVKGARRLTPLEQAETLRQSRVVLTLPRRSDFSFSLQGPRGQQRDIAPDIYNRLLDLLEDRAIKTVGELEAPLAAAGIGLPTLFEALLVMIGRGDLGLAQDEAAQARARPHTDRLNDWVLDHARASGEIATMASPVLAGGVGTTRPVQLFLLGRKHGQNSPEELARFAWGVLEAQGQRIAKDDKPLETPEENLAELTRQAQLFVDHQLPMLQSVQVA